MLTIVSFKDVPLKTDPSYKPIFSRVKFIDGTEFTTDEVPQSTSCKFEHEHVFLLGRHDHVKVRELIATCLVKVYLHDCERFTDNPEIVFSCGLA